MIIWTGDIDKDLFDKALIPGIVADTVSIEPEIREYLIARAHWVYKANKRWGKKIAPGGTKARDLLRSFMEHWKASYIANPERAKKELAKWRAEDGRGRR